MVIGKIATTVKHGRCHVWSLNPAAESRLATTSSTRVHTCPFCKQVFPLRKTLNRHMSSALHLSNGPSFTCNSCGIGCSRKDILSRHKASQHNERGKTVQCSVCHQHIRPRSLRGHLASRACKRAEKRNHAFSNGVGTLRSYWNNSNSSNAGPAMPPVLPAVLDINLLGAWLFVKVKPFQDTYALWLGRTTIAPSRDVLKLKGLLFKTIRNAIASPSVAQDPFLVDVLALFNILSCMTDGWNATQVHRYAFVRLVHLQLSVWPRSREEFSNVRPAEAFQDILRKVHDNASDILKCERIIQMAIKMMRSSAFDTVCTSVKLYKRLENSPHTRTQFEYRPRAVWFQQTFPQLKAIAELASTVTPNRTKSALPADTMHQRG